MSSYSIFIASPPGSHPRPAPPAGEPDRLRLRLRSLRCSRAHQTPVLRYPPATFASPSKLLQCGITPPSSPANARPPSGRCGLQLGAPDVRCPHPPASTAPFPCARKPPIRLAFRKAVLHLLRGRNREGGRRRGMGAEGAASARAFRFRLSRIHRPSPARLATGGLPDLHPPPLLRTAVSESSNLKH